MKRRWRVAFVIVGIVVALLLGVVVVGALLPADHVASRTVTVRATPEKIYEKLAAFEAYPSWCTGVTSVERIADRDGHAVWRETNGFGVITYERVEATPPHRLVTRIADPDLPFGGTWTYELVPGASGTTVTITERGTVKNPLFRFLSRFVFGYTATMDRVLRALGNALGESLEPR